MNSSDASGSCRGPLRGSNNRQKKRQALAREWQRVTEQEKGKVHEITNALIKGHACRFVVEDLKIPNMVRNRYLSRSILEQQWGYFVHCLTYKASSAGGWVVTSRSPQHDTAVLWLRQPAQSIYRIRPEDVPLLRLRPIHRQRRKRGCKYPSQGNGL